MPISTFNLTIGLLALSLECAQASQACRPIEEADKVIQDSNVVYESAAANWQVVVDKKSYDVVIKNKKTNSTCKTIVEDLTNVYFSKSSPILFRSNLITSDDIYFIDANTCKEARRSLSVSGYSNSKVALSLKASGFCFGRQGKGH